MTSKKSSGNLFGFILSKQFLIHLGIAVVIFIVLIFAVLQALKSYTHHGEFVEVPPLKNFPLPQAVATLEKENLRYEIVDSVFFSNITPGMVVEQSPQEGERIKRYRTIYLTINSYTTPEVSLPDVRDLSFRHAKATLEAAGFEIAHVQYVPSEYQDLVKEVHLAGRVATPGKKISYGSKLTLVVGEGLNTDSLIPIPSFRSLGYEEALQQINANNLSSRSVQFDEQPTDRQDSTLFVVYKQLPITDTPVMLGSSVSIWLTKNRTLIDESIEKKYSIEEEIMQSIPRGDGKDIEDFEF